MKDLLEFLVKSIVNSPEEVGVGEEEAKDGVFNYTIKVAPQDMGVVIGKEGKSINAIRKIAQIKAARKGYKVWISLLEEPSKEKPPS